MAPKNPKGNSKKQQKEEDQEKDPVYSAKRERNNLVSFLYIL
jgi:hypothetical protein